MKQKAFKRALDGWLDRHVHDPQQLDCTTAVALKILDGKCKMPEHERASMLTLYQHCRAHPGALFDEHHHALIGQALACPDDTQLDGAIHRLRRYAEASIPKAVMKVYKAQLRRELFSN